MDFNPGFFDKDGLLRTRRITEYGVPETKDAFNGLIYTAYFKTLLSISGNFSYLFFEDVIKNSYQKSNKDISHDDMTGVVCQKIIPYNIKWSRYWYRTEAFLYLYCAGHKWVCIFFPLLSLKMIFSSLTKNKAKNGSFDTDGPLLAWVIYQNFNFTITKKICEWGLRRNFGEKYLSKIFEIKFPGNEFTDNADQPCRIVSRFIDGIYLNDKKE